MPEASMSNRITVTTELLPAAGRFVCEVVLDGAEPWRAHQSTSTITASRQYELVITGRGDPEYKRMLASARIRRIVIVGGRIGQPSVRESPLLQAHRLLSDGDPSGAFALYELAGTSTAAQWAAREVGRFAALIDSGRTDEAGAALRRAMAEARRDSERRVSLDHQLTYLVRASNHAYGGYQRHALGPAYVGYYYQSWESTWRMHSKDPQAIASLTTELEQLGELDVAAFDQEGLYEKLVLLETRGQAWWQLGRYALAKRDLQQAIDVGQSLVAGPPLELAEDDSVRERLESVTRWLAVIEASAGHEDAALGYAEQSLDVAESRPAARDHLLVQPEIRARAEQPRWRVLLGD